MGKEEDRMIERKGERECVVALRVIVVVVVVRVMS